MRGFLLLSVVIVLICVRFSESFWPTDQCQDYSQCSVCIDEGCVYCAPFGCRNNTFEERQQCMTETDGMLYDNYCPSWAYGCLPSNSSCSDCTSSPRGCYIESVVGFDNNQFCSWYSDDSFGSDICHVADDSIRKSIQNSLPRSLKYSMEEPTSIKLSRNQLHVIHTFDGCGSHPMVGVDNYYPEVLFIGVSFILPYSMAQISIHDGRIGNHAVRGSSASSSPSGNETTINLSFVTGCNKEMPLNPLIYVLNNDGMIVVAIQDKDLEFQMVAHHVAPFDDQVVPFWISLIAADVTKVEVSFVIAFIALISSLL